jgi:hypothetical protein
VEYGGDKKHALKKIAVSVLHAFPSLRYVTCTILADARGQMYVADVGYQIGPNGQYNLQNEQKSLSASQFFIDMLFPELGISQSIA